MRLSTGRSGFEGAQHSFWGQPQGVGGFVGIWGDGVTVGVVSFGQAANGSPGFALCAGGHWGELGVSGESSAGLRCRQPPVPL